MTRPTTLYRFFDADGALLYIGITSVGPNRWRAHEDHRAWWQLVARTAVEHFPDRASAAAAEEAAILAEQPLHNTVHLEPRKPRPVPTYRRHGEGSLVPKDDGRWQVAVTLRPGRRYNVSLRSEDEARLLLAVFRYRGVREKIRLRAAEILTVGADWEPRPRR